MTRAWRSILARTKTELGTDNIGIIAAGVAFYGFLALFPAIGAFASLYGLVADPQNADAHVEALGMLPGDVREMITGQLARVAGASNGALSLSLLVSLFVSLWSANKGTKAMLEALNIAYDVDVRRSFLQKNLHSIALTVGFLMAAAVALLLIVAIPIALEFVGLAGPTETLVSVSRWPILAALGFVAFCVLYRFGPNRQPRPAWGSLSWGSALGTLLWILGSWGFSLYASRIGDYDKTYGTIGAVVVVLLWLYLTAYAILLGAELNAEVESSGLPDARQYPA